MNKIINMVTMIVLAMGFMGCSSKFEKNHSVEREKTLIQVNNIINQHTSDGSHSAIAISMVKNNNYILGYAHDTRSQQKAKQIAMQQCKKGLENKEKKIIKECQIYRLDNKHIRTLK
jgi:hypothetical protein